MRRHGHKFNAVRTVIDGHSFASKAEARRYGELTMMEKAGEIEGLILQPKYPLYTSAPTDTGWQTKLVGNYVADFTYLDRRNGCRQVVEDVKGMKTDLYLWKKRHFELQHGITITEIGRR